MSCLSALQLQAPYFKWHMIQMLKNCGSDLTMFGEMRPMGPRGTLHLALIQQVQA